MTTASDVYSLGAVLFHLLTGRLPHEIPADAGAFALERAICEQTAPRPSTVVEVRHARQLRGDLDYICLKALRKEPQSRYASVEQFSADLLNYLEGRPVVARKGTFAYRASRFVRRHKYSIAASLVLAASVIGGVVSTVYQQRRAERRFQQVRNLANTFMFDIHNGLAEIPGTTSVRQKLVQTALKYLDTLAPDAPGDQALQLEIAAAYQKIGNIQNSGAISNFGDAREGLRSWHKALEMTSDLMRRSPENVKAKSLAASIHLDIGDTEERLGHFGVAEQEYQQALALGQLLDAIKHAPSSRSILVTGWNALGDLNMRTGNPDKALEFYQLTNKSTETAMQRSPTAKHWSVFLAQNLLRTGEARHAAGEPAAGLAAYQQAEALLTKNAIELPEFESTIRETRVTALSNMGDVLGGKAPHLGQPAAAQQMYRDAIQMSETLVATDPKDARHGVLLGEAYRRAILTAAPEQALQYSRQLAPLAGRLLEHSPEDVAYRTFRAAALWGIARGTARPSRIARYQEAEAAHKALKDRFPDDSNVRLQWLRFRLDFAEALLARGDRTAANERFRAILSEIGSLPKRSVFLRAVASEAEKHVTIKLEYRSAPQFPPHP